ncbi:MAG: penicillin-binding transpeptidase domain-containing protein [Halomonas aquamarina]|jgi:cell division protein FtsI (penicillin-binding protein 3)|uniref:peptidoglycan D,D-transpeptidase FtsI family protein n=1 Tax=unclassified Halomonas TaxID=2609666 RepID=UPI000C1066A5|nr:MULTISPECIES: penicillin-binding transpeptidase domain-containing protein [unclassified Halomonas]MAG53239.1 cell division protein [Halomonas sp.]MCP1303871.1 penicillin-binding transpeptidase domain-containing protein [Halomonas sp. R1t8]MCP1328913.1 penicillin-binding transpeptidase domain-containing protein [Halomonas sp. R1t4]PHR04765.1 MAG: cell division protein [Halomonas sp.]|tara:strand:- start:157 stop:1863 length:1707 start_codon:yes stop_codon:yes gene_type:complete
MKREGRGGKSRQYPIAPPLAGGRFFFILLAVGLASAILIGRITLLQVIDRPFLQSQGDARTLRHEAIPAHRGMITDRNGEPLAISTPVVTLWANPQELPTDAIQRVMLAQALGMSLDDFESRVARYSSREFMYLRRQMTPDAAQRILDLRTPGVYPQREYKRYYPAGEVAAQILGVTNVDDVGQEGLELAYQPYLAGHPGQRRVIKDRRGRLVRELGVIREAQPGGELTLAIDQRIQYMAYRELRAAVAEHQADGGVLVMMDARTGEVLAMANLPSYNPNNRAGLDPRGLRNQALVDVFEPGSVMKPLAMAAVLESGIVGRDAVVDTSPGWMRLDQFTIRDFRNYGELDLAGILEKSSNIGMSRLALQLSDTAIWEKYNQLGLGQSPGTGFPGESTGNLPARIQWSRSERAALSYGYGLSVTAVQLASAYTALANNGERLPPSLLRLSEPPQGIPAIEPSVANDLLEILETSVGAYTGGRRARVEGYRVGGKTGTVRKTGQQGYATDAYRSVFAGIAPISDPRIVTVVMIDHPKAGEFYGGAVAAPVFSSVTGNALRLLDVPPDYEVE